MGLLWMVSSCEAAVPRTLGLALLEASKETSFLDSLEDKHVESSIKGCWACGCLFLSVFFFHGAVLAAYFLTCRFLYRTCTCLGLSGSVTHGMLHLEWPR